MRRARAVLGSGHRRLGSLLGVATVAGLAAGLLGLESIGAPPRVRIDALWVHGHRSAVRTIWVCVAVAAVASTAALLIGRRRLLVLAAWAAAIAIVVVRYGDRAPVILAEVIRRL